MKGFKKIISVILLSLVVIAVIGLLVFSMINRSKNRPTFIFGYAILWVETGSMEPTISERSYILVKNSDGENLSKGDVICFVCEDETSAVYKSLVTHRIVDFADGGYKTKGDNTAADKWTVAPKDVCAVYVKNLNILTVFGRIFTSYIGLLIIFALFIVGCVFIYVPDIVNALRDGKEDKKRLSEEEIEKLVQEKIKEMTENDHSEGVR